MSTVTNIAKTISPIDDSVIFEQPYASDKEILRSIEEANTAQRTWSALTIDQRAVVCRKALDYFIDNQQDIAKAISEQMGRPISQSPGEINGLVERGSHMIDIAESSLANIIPTAKPGFKRYIKRDPLGIVFIVAPWNYPLLTTVNSVIPALMAGNAVLIKGSIQTPLVNHYFTKAFAAAGAPDKLVSGLCLDHQQTQQLLQESRVDYCCFTGSVAAGRKIEHAIAGGFKGLTLELGGKDPAYVCADADFDATVENLVDGAFFNSGQSCCGIERIYVADSIYRSFVDAYVEQVKTYKLANPLDKNTTLGPVVKSAAAAWIREQSREAIDQGATACIDAANFTADIGSTAYLAPQVLIDVNHNMRVMTEETFGPVVGIMPVSSDADAISKMNDSDLGLTASIWTQDLARAEAIGQAVQTGTVFMNRCDYLDPALVWTGVKNTGRGASLSALSYQSFSQAKSFHLKHS